MTIKRLSETKPIEWHGIQIYELLTDKNAKMGMALSRMQPNAKHTTHKHGVMEEKYYFLSGEGLMRLGEEEFTVGEGTAVDIQPGIVHTLENTGAEDLVFIVVSSPPYTPEDEEQV